MKKKRQQTEKKKPNLSGKRSDGGVAGEEKSALEVAPSFAMRSAHWFPSLKQ